ncbi:MAG: glycosyltransferase family 2 protein [Patescibacteria group bacterium]|nr:glycosyltransferase family 2 protein [Patescibacteria group bacterium]MCL5431750.1 glycosyltransferase family 2 protein [Patescibacteria group bacterium]
MSPLVSIIIPTYNRREPLTKALETLLSQAYPHYEIIVVDQSDKTFIDKRVKIIKTSPPNTPRARNIGAAVARGEILIFCDDDILADKNFVAAHVNNYADQKITAVNGRVITPGQKPALNCRTVGKITPWGTVAGGYDSKIRQEIKNLIGCNMSVRKQALLAIGGFDEHYIGNGLREETDMARRLVTAGGKIIFDPKAKIIHVRAATGGARKDNRMQWQHDFFHNEMYFALKHLNWFWLPVFWLVHWQWFARCMFGFGREVSRRSMTMPFIGIYDAIKDYRR